MNTRQRAPSVHTNLNKEGFTTGKKWFHLHSRPFSPPDLRHREGWSCLQEIPSVRAHNPCKPLLLLWRDSLPSKPHLWWCLPNNQLPSPVQGCPLAFHPRSPCTRLRPPCLPFDPRVEGTGCRRIHQAGLESEEQQGLEIRR